MHACAPITDSTLRNGDSLTLLETSRAQVCGTAYALAAILGDGSVVTWGNADLWR